MAIDTLPSWISTQPSDFVRAGQEGADAGLGVARLNQAAQQHSAQLGMEAQQLRQQANIEGARLSQQQHLAEMEAAARREVAQQNFARQQQQLLTERAYQQARLGLGQAHLEQQQALADAKAQEAALTYAQESGLAQHISGGGDMATGLMKFPRARGIASALKSSMDQEQGPIEVQDIPGVGKVVRQKGSDRWQIIPEEKHKQVKNKDGSIDWIMPDGSVRVIKAAPKGSEDKMLNPDTNSTDTTTSTSKSILERAKDLFSSKPSVPAQAAESASPFKEGQTIRNKKDGKLYIVKGGIPIPVEANLSPPHDEEQ